LLGQCPEGLGLTRSEVSEDLTVNLDSGELETVYKSSIRQPMQAGRSVDTLNPQSAEYALASPTISICVLKRLFDTFERNAI
jgi:hypothetical protein